MVENPSRIEITQTGSRFDVTEIDWRVDRKAGVKLDSVEVSGPVGTPPIYVISATSSGRKDLVDYRAKESDALKRAHELAITGAHMMRSSNCQHIEDLTNFAE